MITIMPAYHHNGPPPRIELITGSPDHRCSGGAGGADRREYPACRGMQPGMSVSYVAQQAGVARSFAVQMAPANAAAGLQAVQPMKMSSARVGSVS